MIPEPMLILISGAYACYLVGRAAERAGNRYIAGVLSVIILASSMVSLYPLAMRVLSHGSISYYLYNSQLVVDELGIFLSAICVGLGMLVSLYSIRYMEHHRRLDAYYSLLILMIAGMMGIGFAADLFNLYVFFELMSITSFVLVAFEKERWEPVEAGFKYLVMSTAGSLVALFGISLIYSSAGSLSIAAISARASTAVTVATIMIIVGFGVKASIVPLHTWLPDAHPAAPSGISAMLSGIVIQSGLIAMMKCLMAVPPQIPFGTSLILFSVLTMTVGNLMALVQNDVKRLLAYSSIAHMGYILMGIGIGFQFKIITGLDGGLFHITTHALMKGLAFLCAGAILYRVGTRDLREIRGIGHKMPVTCFSFSVAALSLCATPPLAGFMSELLIIKAGIESASHIGALGILLALIVLMNCIISLGYYLPLIRTLFLSPEREFNVREAPLTMLIPMIIMVLLLVILGIFPEIALKIVHPASMLLGGK